MSKGERKRTMVYSNVHKKADSKSASKKNEFSDFDNEVFIGVKSFPKPNEVNKKRNNSKKGKSGQAVDNIKKKNQNQTNKTNKANNKVIENEKKKGLISLLKRNKEKQELEDVREIESIKDQEIEIEVEPTEKEQKPFSVFISLTGNTDNLFRDENSKTDPFLLSALICEVFLIVSLKINLQLSSSLTNESIRHTTLSVSFKKGKDNLKSTAFTFCIVGVNSMPISIAALKSKKSHVQI